MLIEVIAMRRYYHLRGFRLGRASECRFIPTEDNLNLEILTIPISLKFPYLYTLKDFRVRLISGELHQASELYTTYGDCWGDGMGTVFTLDWDNRKGFIAIAHLSGKTAMIGTPIIAESIGQEGEYRLIVEIYKNDKVLISKPYILSYRDSLRLLEDNTNE